MPKKQKQTTPEVTPVTPTAPDTLAWPAVGETRSLPCQLRPAELAEKADEQARHQLDLGKIEGEKKSAMSQFTARIDEKKSQLYTLAQVISDRSEYRSIKCEWRFEQAGFNAEGEPIYHPEQKTLVRLDTGAAVEVRAITEVERQLKLDLETETDAAIGSEGEADEDGDVTAPETPQSDEDED